MTHDYSERMAVTQSDSILSAALHCGWVASIHMYFTSQFYCAPRSDAVSWTSLHQLLLLPLDLVMLIITIL